MPRLWKSVVTFWRILEFPLKSGFHCEVPTCDPEQRYEILFFMLFIHSAGRGIVMLELPVFLAVVNALALPMFGLWALLSTKLSVGDALRRAERRFLIALVIISLVTLRTVMRLDDVWLIHTLTLASMVLGVFTVPSREGALAI